MDLGIGCQERKDVVVALLHIHECRKLMNLLEPDVSNEEAIKCPSYGWISVICWRDGFRWLVSTHAPTLSSFFIVARGRVCVCVNGGEGVRVGLFTFSRCARV